MMLATMTIEVYKIDQSKYWGVTMLAIRIGKPQEWLVLASGLIFLVAVPGGVMLAAQPRR